MLHKTITLFALFLFLTFPASAQVGGIGVKGGVDFATLRSDEDEDELEYQTDFVIGVYGQIPTASDVFTIQPEVLYARKGASLEDQDVGEETIETDINLDYIEVPVLLKVGVPVQANFSPNLLAGPYIGFAINKEINAEGGDQSSSQDLDDNVKTLDYGIALGADFDVVLSGYSFNVGGRYDLGLANIADGEGSDEVDLNTSTFMITLGFAL